MCRFAMWCLKTVLCSIFCDNLNDPHGVMSTLYQDIASEIFEAADLPGGVAYCTDVERKMGKSVNEWLGDAVQKN